jgi:hypothetical protein
VVGEGGGEVSRGAMGWEGRDVAVSGHNSPYGRSEQLDNGDGASHISDQQSTLDRVAEARTGGQQAIARGLRGWGVWDGQEGESQGEALKRRGGRGLGSDPDEAEAT